jgi:regulatory protein
MTESDKYKNTLSKAMTLCSKREYCREDIHVKLLSWGNNEKDCDKILNTLEKENFINEIRYCEAFTRDKFRYNKWGKVKIATHLKSKKIPSEKINKALDLIDNELYINTLKDLLAVRNKNITAKNQYDLKGKLLRYGLSKGFESSLLYDILNDI